MMTAPQAEHLARFCALRQDMLRMWNLFVVSGAVDHATAMQEIRATSTGMAALVALHEEELLGE